MKYVRDLSKADDKVMSVSPQERKENRPFVGIVVIMDSKKYCIPLTSPKPKHEKMKNDLNFSKYIIIYFSYVSFDCCFHNFRQFDDLSELQLWEGFFFLLTKSLYL